MMNQEVVRTEDHLMVWKCPECDDSECKVDATYYHDNGTPVCECDEDMEYSHMIKDPNRYLWEDTDSQAVRILSEMWGVGKVDCEFLTSIMGVTQEQATEVLDRISAKWEVIKKTILENAVAMGASNENS